MSAASKRHLAAVAALGCIICRQPAECHHPRRGAGMGRKSSDFEVIPLCPRHHRLGGFGVAIHAGQKTWETKYGTEAALLTQTLVLLAEQNQHLVGRRDFGAGFVSISKSNPQPDENP